MQRLKIILLASLLICVTVLTIACGADGYTGGTATSILDSGDPEYEAQTIRIEGILELGGGIAEISIAELRTLPQHELDAHYVRTTGRSEEFHMVGPLLSDIIAFLGGNLDDYAGLAIIGRDGYFFLFSREVLDATPELMIAVTVDGEPRLGPDSAPARAGVPGQFGPYWVRMIESIVLYEYIPQKEITSVWVFSALTEGIEPVDFEYFGSLDSAIPLDQVFSRFEHVDSRAFFTMKAADGFMRDEAISLILVGRHYMKIDGVDAPTNVSPRLMMGMNVRDIAWISTNADAAVFPYMMLGYLDTQKVHGQVGVPIDEVLFAAGLRTVRAAEFDFIGTAGERVRVSGEVLNRAILVPHENKPNSGGSLIWLDDYGYPNIDDLLRIRLVEGG